MKIDKRLNFLYFYSAVPPWARFSLLCSPPLRSSLTTCHFITKVVAWFSFKLLKQNYKLYVQLNLFFEMIGSRPLQYLDITT